MTQRKVTRRANATKRREERRANVSLTEEDWHIWHGDTLARVERENAVHIKVWKQVNEWSSQYHRMWRGKCSCGKTWQFHFFGATLGYGLEHIRREIAGVDN